MNKMKQGWEIKKIGEVATILNGYAFDSKLFSEDSNDVPLIRIRDIKRGYTETFYKGNFSEEYIIRKGDYLIGMDGEFNIAEWEGENALLNQRVCKIIANKIVDRYLFWYMPIVLKQIEDATPFVTVKHLSSKQLINTTIPIPPREEQERIVAELDCLSGVIEKKREQLKQLDALAQSIFYQMFGDPITNEKRWEVKKLGDCFYHIKNGANIKQERGAGGIPITRIETLSGGVFNRDRLGYANIENISKYEHYVLNSGDLLLSHINSKIYIGRIVVYNKRANEIIIHGMNLLRLISNADTIVPMYMQYFSYTDSYKNQIANRRKDAVNQSSISIADLKTISIPTPPLALQQEFVDKIEAIEKQKELIKKSISETETLFNARMDYYFN